MSYVQLISAPAEETGMLEEKWYPPMGLLYLGTYLKEKGHEVEIIDGHNLNTNQIQQKLKAPLIGISFDILSSKSFEQIAKSAKQKGATVVVGGQAATPLTIPLLKNSDIDFVVKYDGEEAIRQLAEGISPYKIPNLVYRTPKGIKINPDLEVDLTNLPTPNRNLVDLERYIKEFGSLTWKTSKWTLLKESSGCRLICSAA